MVVSFTGIDKVIKAFDAANLQDKLERADFVASIISPGPLTVKPKVVAFGAGTDNIPCHTIEGPSRSGILLLMKPFQLLVKPAAGDCNLACEYCFYRRTTPALYPDAKKHRMSRDTMAAMVKDIMSHRFPETIFCWQGGEPTLMGLDFFEDVIAAQSDCGKSGQVVGNAFQTNGVLIDDDWARFLARYRFVVGLSLDGPREVHDRYRQDLGGKGTFTRVMNAAETLRRHGVAFNILSVVNRFNQDRAREVYRFFRAHGFDYLQFIPILEVDPDTDEPTNFSATPDGLGRFFAELFDEYRREGYPHVSERNLDAVMNLHLNGKAGVCTLEKKCGGYLVVEHNGDIYPCDFFVEDKWRLGNISEGRLHTFFSRPLMKKFAAGKSKYPADCDSCERLAWCHGGCQKDRLPDRADGPGKTYFCESYKALFDTTDNVMEGWRQEFVQREQAETARRRAALAVTPGKVGRNDPCPCGSGKKFKKCCG